MNKLPFLGLTFLLILHITSQSAFAQQMTSIDTAQFDLDLSVGPSLEFLEDTTGIMSLDEVRNSAGFLTVYPGTDNPKGHYWVKFKVLNNTPFDEEVVCLFDRTSYVTFYQTSIGQPTYTALSGGGRKRSEMYKNDNRRFVRIKLESRRAYTIFVKFENKSDYLPDFGIRLLSEDIHYQEEKERLVRDFILYGALLILTVYAISLFFIHKFRPYLWLAIHAFGFMMYSFAGRNYFVDWFFPETTVLGLATPWALIGLLALLVLITIFLQLKNRFPGWYRVMVILICTIIVQFIATIWLVWKWDLYVLTSRANLYAFAVYVVILLALLIATWSDLSKSQRVFGYGVFFFVGVIAMGIISWFMIDLLGRPVVTALSTMAPLGQILIFAIALGIEMRQHEVEKNQALDELNVVLLEQNKKIEQEVVDRTLKINQQKVVLQERNERIETLFKEVHHRVKNNLQLISSLLNMQQEWSGTEDSSKALEDSRSRVVAMSMIHQFLYRTDDISTINFKEYVRELTAKLNEIQVAVDYELVLDFDNEYDFDLDTSISLGLILNELITNSYKYAKRNNEPLQLAVKLTKPSPDYFELVYSDDGSQITTPLDELVKQGFGLRLASRLSRQLQGKFEYKYASRNFFYVTFASQEARIKMADAY